MKLLVLSMYSLWIGIATAFSNRIVKQGNQCIHQHRLNLKRPNSLLQWSDESSVVSGRRYLLSRSLQFITVGAGVTYGLSTTATATVSNPLFGLFQLERKDAPVNSMINQVESISTVGEAMKIIESSCDRRFLHAVVSSDYRFMYRGVPKESENELSIRTEPFDLLDPETYGSNEAATYFATLEKDMVNQPIRPSNGHLATTNVDEARAWGGGAISVWPLVGSPNHVNEVHYAWLEDGGAFWPSSSDSKDGRNRNVIIDGIDCGRMSLEDALTSKNSEIMFGSQTFLAVPASRDAELISKLETAFII